MQRESFLLLFEVLCFISTACLISKCIHQYYLDDDTSQLEYRKFHLDIGSIYPSISICFPSSSFFDYAAIHKIVMSMPKLAKQVSKKCRYSGIGCNLVVILAFLIVCHDNEIFSQFFAYFLMPDFGVARK